MKVLIAGGGTGGHVFPGIAVAEELARSHAGSEVVFVGGTRGLEAQAVPEAGFRIRYVAVQGFSRRRWWSWPWSAVVNLVGLAQSMWIVMTERPDVVLGTGGYVSGPVSLAAVMLGRPLVLQEQNSIPGLTNRWLARIAKEVHLSFTESRVWFERRDNLKITGNPVRAFILSGERAAGLRHFGLAEGRPTVFVFGGSLGATRINDAAVDAMRKLRGRLEVQFILQTGRADYERVRQVVEQEGLPAKVMPFLREIHLAYAAADLLVCRSGAMTLAEIAACGTPAILVPYPYAANNHQEVNAENLVERGAATLILDRDLDGERLVKEIAHLIADRQTLRKMSAHARTFARLDAAERLAGSLERLASGSDGDDETEPAAHAGGDR